MGEAAKHEEMFNCLHDAIKQEMPDYELVIKESHWLLGALSRVLPAMHADVTVTIAPRVYMPLAVHADSRVAWKVLAHEYIHLRQAQRETKWRFLFKYALPQIMALLALLALVLSPYFLIALVFLLPLPAYYRMRYEMEGYMMSIAVNYWRYGTVDSAQRADIKMVFRSSTYYYMWPFKHWVDRKINTEIQILEKAGYDNRPDYRMVRQLVEQIWSL